MRVLVDADSMPRRIREIIARAASRRRLAARFFSHIAIEIPASEWVSHTRVDDADEAILDECRPEDLVISRDIPLAARLVAMGVTVLNDRGDVYTNENIGERLSIRDAAKEIRDAGLEAPRGRSFGARHVQRFANALDRELTRRGAGRESAGNSSDIGSSRSPTEGRSPGLDDDKPD